MTVGRILERPSAAPEAQPRRRPPLHPGDYLIPVSVICWVVGLGRTHVPTSFQPYGLITSLPLIYYAAIALLIVSAVLELRHAQLSEWRLAAHAVSLVVMLYATSAVVYPAGRYSWLYKTIGVVQYVNAHGRLDDHVDIYQNWPGFFALAAWFTKVAGVGSPLAYAKWAQVFFELAALPLLHLIYDGLALPIRQRWIAIFLYASTNWIAQDYFSPQALGTVLSLGVLALAMRWLYTPSGPRDRPIRRTTTGSLSSWRRRLGSRDDQQFDAYPRGGSLSDEPASAGHPRTRTRWWSFPREHDPRWSASICVAIAIIFFYLSAEHELSPYIVAVQLGALALAKQLRPRWLPIVLAVIAFGYLVPRFGFVNSHFGLLHSIGHFFSNVRSPAQSTTRPTGASVTISRCCELLSLGVWCLALTGAWLRRRSGQAVLALLLPAFAPFCLLALLAYGNEGVLRVYLFSLPWSAALAASALASSPQVILAKTKNYRARLRYRNRGQGTFRILVTMTLALGLWFPAFFGNDSYNVIPAPEVAALTSFQQSSPPSVYYVAIDNSAIHDTSNYNTLDEFTIFGGIVFKNYVNPHIATTILSVAVDKTSRSDPVYVVITNSMINYNRVFQLVPADAFTLLEKSLANTPPWTLVLHKDGVIIYELPPHIEPVFASSNPSLLPEPEKTVRRSAAPPNKP